MQAPKITFPMTANLFKSPTDALTEIKTSLSTTVNSIQSSLTPSGGPALPKIADVFKGPQQFLASLTGNKSNSGNPGNPGNPGDNPIKVEPSGVPGVTEEVISRRGM